MWGARFHPNDGPCVGWAALARIAAATGAMLAVLWLLPPADRLAGLVLTVALGASTYALAVTALHYRFVLRTVRDRLASPTLAG